MLEMTLTFRVHQNAIQHLDHLERLLYFKSRSDMLRMAVIEAVYYTMRGKLKLRGRLAGKTKVIGCRLPEKNTANGMIVFGMKASSLFS